MSNIRKLKKAFQYLIDPDYRFVKNSSFGMYDHWSDEDFLKRRFSASLKKELDLGNPQTFNEKLQWLKLYDRKPEYIRMVDKLAAKDYVAEKIGEEYIIPTLGVWDRFDDIDFDALPNQFVLKCTHDSGGLVICKDKSNLNIRKAKRKIERSLNSDFYLRGREWPYKNVPRRIIAEKYMEDAHSDDLRDYKFYCFDGVPKLLYISESLSDHAKARISFASMDWNMLPVKRCDYAPFTDLPKQPENFDLMVELSKILSAEIPFLRVDLYEINGKVYFGELTLYPGSGFTMLQPEEWDYKLGSWLELPKIKMES